MPPLFAQSTSAAPFTTTLLVIATLLPLGGSLLLFGSPQLDYRSARKLALTIVLATLAMSLVFVVQIMPSQSGPQFTTIADVPLGRDQPVTPRADDRDEDDPNGDGGSGGNGGRSSDDGGDDDD